MTGLLADASGGVRANGKAYGANGANGGPHIANGVALSPPGQPGGGNHVGTATTPAADGYPHDGETSCFVGEAAAAAGGPPQPPTSIGPLGEAFPPPGQGGEPGLRPLGFVPGSPEPKPLPMLVDMSPPRPRTRTVGLQVRLGTRTLQERAPLWTTLTTGQAPIPRSVS